MSAESPSTAIAQQTSRYSVLVGKNIPHSNFTLLQKLVQSADPESVYKQHDGVPFWYEILDVDGWLQTVMDLLVVPWIENQTNIDRAAQTVGRLPHSNGKTLYIGSCIFRFKRLANLEWAQMEEDLRIPTTEDKEYAAAGKPPKPQTLVFYSIEDWSTDNGFFMDLAAGSDVCIDSEAKLWLPPTGGGKGICFVLDI